LGSGAKWVTQTNFSALASCQINAAQKQRQIFRTEDHFGFSIPRGRGPPKPTLREFRVRLARARLIPSMVLLKRMSGSSMAKRSFLSMTFH
jgi:hypothetical protein